MSAAPSDQGMDAMKFRSALSVRLAVASAVSLIALGACAARAAPPAEPHSQTGYSLYGDPGAPDISGLWLGSYSSAPGNRPQDPTPDREITPWAPWPPPLTPEYQKKADERIAAAKKGRQIGDLGARCLPFGQIQITLGIFPDEVIQTPGEVSLWFWGAGSPLVIWTDGRDHPKDLAPSYDGHSIGYWVGDTLYVDTVGIMPTTPIDPGPRTPHSGKLHMKWTMQRVAPDVLHVHVTLYDADALTEPMVVTAIWRRKAGHEWEMLDDASCFENNRNAPDAQDVTGFQKF